MGNSSWRHVWLLALCQALMMTNNALLITSSALVGAALADNVALATLPLALQFMATMLMSIPASFFMARVGRRSGFLFASLIGISGGALATFAIIEQSFWLFTAGTVLIGSFNGFGNYYRFAAVDIVADSMKSRAISYVMAGGVIAAILGPNLANWAHDGINAAPFAGSYLVATLLYLLTTFILLITKIPHQHSAQRINPATSLLTLLKRPVFVAAVISGMFGYAVMSLVMTATPLSMHHNHHSLGDTAFVIQWHVLGMFAPSFITGYLISRFGVINIMLIGALLLLAAVVGNLAGVSLMHYWMALTSLGIGWNFVFIGATDLLTYSYDADEKAKAQAINDFTVFSGVTVAALTAGYLQNTFGWQIVNVGVLPMIIIIFVALGWLKFSGHHRPVS